MRDEKGRFVKGVRSSQATEFKPGQHWRDPKPYWSKDWLVEEYVNKKRSTYEIAAQFECLGTNIQYFLKKFGIEVRDTAQTRAVKHWGQSGRLNPMYGKRGPLNPNWEGGSTPERQRVYVSFEWRQLKRQILKRDNYSCQDCGSHTNLHIHHIKKWSKFPELRFEPSNLLTLCKDCHKKRHSKNV